MEPISAHAQKNRDQDSEEMQKRLDELYELGSAIYNRLQSTLEPEYNNQFIAIHVDTADYAVGRTSGAATRALRKRHSRDGRLLVMKIGPEPEYGLAARILASDMIAGQSK